MADILQAIKDALTRISSNGGFLDYPNPAQDRYTQTPILFQPQEPGVAGHYVSGSRASWNLDNIDTSKLDIDTIRAIQKLSKDWADTKGYLSIRPSHTVGTTIPHEATHAVYDKGGLKSKANELLNMVPTSTSNMIQTSPTYSSMPKPYAGSPEQITDEGLAFTTSIPYRYGSGDKEEQDYIDKAASLITDPKLKQALYRLYQRGLKR